ncbi:alpha-1,4-glucan--maltose-1-phosphate maltosyltransferase [Streptomyces sp. MP131-18]|uniref:alpha-1,4-glucan--maltose-1-phosphate maltosyltransferase n=1 Tax=Streptomyces sp. MP131-18 TaxID=1857892 RepID=UPI00097C7436|nr:alpha-1,4-glucan--maltose-1-phosphate maltosyltransferase [Streptomyces sp. MP131-18]ONK14120.1 Alpha-1,4-glucan:maltose-1-phosphate maltosyltransferase [Streptomyces sp. MP131-18]
MSGRLAVSEISPVVSGGCHPAKAVVGEHVPVTATIWREGHESLAAAVVWSGPGPDARPVTVPMTLADEGLDRWRATVVPDRPGMWSYRVDAWGDPWATWLHTIRAKTGAGLRAAALSNDLATGAALLDRLAAQAAEPAAARAAAARLRRADLPLGRRLAPALGEDVAALAARHPLRELLTRGPVHRVFADRTRALHGAWYELFPRSTGGRDDQGRPRHGTFATAAADLPRIAAMGFDVVYLPPVHPIGTTHRKGRDNALTAGPDDVGSPWAVGSAEGGHDAVHPALGTAEDFRGFVAAARGLGMEVALDLAFQCSPDHPWVREHPEWFTARPDGTIAYAENPPKRYQDIYPLNFDNDREGLYAELLRIVLHWVDQGVLIFRVDNPHTKPLAFWQYLIWRVKETHPDVLFLAEAFTRPAVLKDLARVGFTQSYTYFTWRTGKQELTDYARELAAEADFLRPNFFVNTPDILPAGLQHGGPGMFALRAALAATLSPTWGVYSGFELYEHLPVRQGTEEYLSSEKYELRPRDHAAAEAAGRSLAPWLTLLNRVRRAHPALRQLRRIDFLDVDNDALLAYVKTDPATGDAVLCVVTLNPFGAEEGTVRGAPAAFGAADRPLVLRDEATGELVPWDQATRVRIDPARAVARLLTKELPR